MSADPYVIFVQICSRKNVDSFLRDAAFGAYKNKCVLAARKIKNEQVRDPTEEELRQIENTLLNESFVEDYVREARRSYEQRRELDFEPYLRTNETGGFWKSVGASILASFIYSVLLVIVFMVAKDQIASWLTTVSQ